MEEDLRLSFSRIPPEMSETAPAIDPYVWFTHLRQKAPVSRMDDNGPWQVARHADVQRILRDHETFSSEVSTRPIEERGGAPSMLFSDPPLHHRLRKLVSVAFKPAHIEAQRVQITSRCEALIDQIPTGEPFDLVPALAAPLPVMVIAEMLGVEDGNMAEFKLWSDAIFSNIADILFAEPSEAAVTASDAMNAYFLKEIEALRISPRGHLLSRLVHVETDEGHLTDEELLSFCRLLLIAGNETTTGLITASARIFHELPETLIQLKEDPELAPSFVEEALRFYSPFSATARRTTRAVDLSGQTIEAGELVIPLLASANRDESVFDTPERFKIDRSPNPHMGLGFGIHFCLGAHLARLEGAITAQRLCRRFSRLRLVEPELAIMGGLGGPKSLIVEVV